MMEKFATFCGIGIPIDIVNCDTDQIIPARYLRRPKTDVEYPKFLWHDLRFNDDGSQKAEFIYNQPPYDKATIVVADLNWGCGSSRENAVYALVANGIRSVIAPSFGDIHFNNCMKWGVLPISLDRDDCERFRQRLHEKPGTKISVNLESQTVIGPDGLNYSFEIDPFDKYRMLNGLDDFGVTREYDTIFDVFEANHNQEYDWLYGQD